jgi:hypothetical protein
MGVDAATLLQRVFARMRLILAQKLSLHIIPGVSLCAKVCLVVCSGLS